MIVQKSDARRYTSRMLNAQDIMVTTSFFPSANLGSSSTDKTFFFFIFSSSTDFFDAMRKDLFKQILKQV